MNSKPGQDQGMNAVSANDDSSLLITSENEGKHVVRKSFRVPVPHGLVTLTHDGRSHSVKDLAMYGVGLAVARPDAFTVGDILKDVQIAFPDRSFHVDVRVVHISGNEGDALVCGMEIIHTHDSGYIDWMTRVISEIKSSVLNAVTNPSR